MATPTRYELAYDFTAFQTSNPTTPLPADKLEIEFNALQTTTDEIIDNLGLIQRSDGALANNSVGNDQLKSEVTIGVNPAADWVTGTEYEANDTVYESNKVYRCLVAHTAGVFATDLAANKWTEILDFDQFITAIEADLAAVEADLAAVENVRTAVEADLAAVEADLAAVENVRTAVEAIEVPGRNVIINGGMDIWQRGTSFSSIANDAFSADRWRYRKTGAMVHDVSRSTDVPTVAEAGIKFNYSLLVDCTTIDSSIAAGDFCLITQRIEGYNFLPIAQKIFTISFWVKATKTGTYCISHNNSGNDRGYVSEYTINASDTWEYKTITVAASPSAGTWDYTNGIGIDINFVLAAGSTFHTTSGSWQTGVFLSTSNQVNACDNTANNFRIVGVQIEPGSAASDFESRTFGQELRLCQRYYEHSYDYGTAIGTVEEVTCPWGIANAADTTLVTCQISYKVEKRSSPTVTIYDTGSGSAGTFVAGATTKTVSSVSGGTKGISRVYATTAMTANTYVRFHYTAGAEL